ncbi:MAG: DNA-methyltransferase [Armatimonadota bacterium]
MPGYALLCGDSREVLPTLPAGSAHCCITSPPYWGLRDYGVTGQVGREDTPEAYVATLVSIFRAVRRVLRDDGTLWLNLGDCYAGNAGQRVPQAIKPKDLLGLPWRVAFALQSDGWYLRTDIVWEKPNCLPESVKDRPTRSHEFVFLLTKQRRYFYDADAIMEPLMPASLRRYQSGLHSAYGDANMYGGKQSHTMAQADCMGAYMNAAGRNRRTVWRIPTKPFRGAHFAVFPPRLVEPCLLAGTSAHGVCPSCGAPWTRMVERQSVTTHNGETDSAYGMGSRANRMALLRQAARAQGEEYVSRRVTVGWQPSCMCGSAERMPATVLDPFTGAGTTGMVALAQGRRFLGIELNAEYVALAEARLAREAADVR